MNKKSLLIAFLWLAGIVAGMQFAKFSSTISLIQTELAIDTIFSGWLLSSLGVIGIVFGVTSGVIVSRFSPLKLVVAFLWWAAAASLLQSLITNPGLMLAIRILEGFSQLILVSAAPTAMLRATPKRYQALVMTFWGTFFGAAFLFMNLIQGPLIQLGGWKGIFYAHGLFAVVVALVLTLFWKSDSQPKDTSTVPAKEKKLSFISEHKAVYKETGSLLPGLLFGCYTIMYLVFLTYLPQRFNLLFPDELMKASFLLISMPIFSLAGTFLSGIVLNNSRRSPIKMIGWSFGAMVGLSILISVVNQDLLFLVVASAILTFTGILQGAVFATIPYLSDDSTIHAYANGTITQMGNIGTTSGPPIFSLLLLSFGWNVAFLLPIVSSLLGILLIFAFRRKINPPALGQSKN